MQKNPMLSVDIENFNRETAAKWAQRAVLKEIYLVEAKISRDPLIIFPEALSLEHKCSTENIQSAQKVFSILCNFQVAAFSDKAPANLVMKIEASFCTSYIHKLPPLVSRKAIEEAFIKLLVLDSSPDDSPDLEYSELVEMLDYCHTINPISDAWPYWREFVQGMSARMGFPALTVPLLEIAPKKSAPQKAKRQPAKKESTRREKLSA